MPSPSADSKFVLSILKFFKHAQFVKYTQNNFGILKSDILLYKLAHLSILKIFRVYFKDLSIIKTNFVSANGLGINKSKTQLIRKFSNEPAKHCCAIVTDLK